MDDLLGFAAWFLLDALCIAMGRLAIRLGSFNRWRGEESDGDEARKYAAAGALSFVRDGQRVITRTGLAFVGLAVWIGVVLVLLALW